METFTLVRESDGVPLVKIDASSIESANRQVQPGHFIVVGDWLGKWKWNGTEMVPSERAFEELKSQLYLKMFTSEISIHSTEIVTTFGTIVPTNESLSLINLAACSRKTQAFTFNDGVPKTLTATEFETLSDEVYSAMSARINKRSEDLITLRQAVNRTQLLGLIATYWPTEESDP